jgi:hypothetical protein
MSSLAVAKLINAIDGADTIPSAGDTVIVPEVIVRNSTGANSKTS